MFENDMSTHCCRCGNSSVNRNVRLREVNLLLPNVNAQRDVMSVPVVDPGSVWVELREDAHLEQRA